MNFIDYLTKAMEAAPRERAYADMKASKRGVKTPQQKASRKRTFLKQKIKKYQAAFLATDNRATSMQLAISIDVCRDSVNHDLKELIAGKMVIREGSLPSKGGGAKRAYLYSWDFDKFPILETKGEEK